MEKNSNKKVVKAVKEFVIKTAAKTKALDEESKKILKNIERKWDSTSPERDRVDATVKQFIQKTEEQTNKIIQDVTQLKKDVSTGFKEGVKTINKKKTK